MDSQATLIDSNSYQDDFDFDFNLDGSEETRIRSSRGKYSKVPSASKEMLIKLVESRNNTIKSAANILNIKFSTAKNIIANYRKEKKV